MTDRPLRIMVLAGGPDRERQISLASGAAVAGALKNCGHIICQRDATPADLSSLDEWARWGGDLVFGVMHGPWGEGGGLQGVLEDRHIPYVGSDARSSAQCMAKDITKRILQQHGLPTPPYEVCAGGDSPGLAAPVVLKPIAEGSSIDVVVCDTDGKVRSQIARFVGQYDRILIEQYVRGKELTVGIVAGPSGDDALPVVLIQPKQGHYDYQAKYARDDTGYVFDPGRMGIAASKLEEIKDIAIRAHTALGCRDLSRVDVILDDRGIPWILEINSIPGFTDHSLLPKAAEHAGLRMPELLDRMVQAAMDRSSLV